MIEKKVCPACQKEVDPKAPLCQCGDDLLPPVRRAEFLLKVGITAATVVIALLACKALGWL